MQPWSLNNVALKYIRFVGESPCGVPRADPICDLTSGLHVRMEIGKIDHDATGPGYSFESPAVVGQFLPWSPAQMLVDLRPDAIARMGLRQHGISQLTCEGFPDILDGMRINAARETSVSFPPGVEPPHLGFRHHLW